MIRRPASRTKNSTRMTLSAAHPSDKVLVSLLRRLSSSFDMCFRLATLILLPSPYFAFRNEQRSLDSAAYSLAWIFVRKTYWTMVSDSGIWSLRLWGCIFLHRVYGHFVCGDAYLFTTLDTAKNDINAFINRIRTLWKYIPVRAFETAMKVFNEWRGPFYRCLAGYIYLFLIVWLSRSSRLSLWIWW